jgi:hypothetical protein
MSIFMLSTASASNTNLTSLGISYTKTNVNTYNVTFWDNNSLNVTINQISTSNITHFSINKTTTKTYVITSNLTLVMLYNNIIIKQVVLQYTSIASFFSLTISALYNETYLVQYHTLIPATLLVKNFTGATILSQELTNQYGFVYIPSGLNPNSAVILYNNTPEIIQPFPYIIPPQTHTIIVYEGLSDKNAILIVFGSFFGSFLLALSVIVETKRIKHKLGTNKSDLLEERLENNPLANTKIQDQELLKGIVKIVQEAEESRLKYEKAKEELDKLIEKVEKLSGKMNEH